MRNSVSSMLSAFTGLFKTQIVHTQETPASLEKDETIPVKPDTSSFTIPWDNLQREWEELSSQDNYDGFRMEVAKQVTKNMVINHSIMMGTSMAQDGYMYQFGPTYQTPNQSTVLLSRYGADGSLNAKFFSSLTESLKAKINLHSHLADSQRNVMELSMDYNRPSWTSSNKLIWQGTWLLNSSYSQRICKGLTLGAECTAIAANLGTIGTIGGRYEWKNNIFSAKLCRSPDFKVSLLENCHSAKVGFCRKVTDRLSLGGEYEYNTSGQESTCRMGYLYSFKNARIQGLIDTAGKISMCLNDMHGFGVSAIADYWEGQYKFGFMYQVMPPPSNEEIAQLEAAL
eukprot:GHVL01000436.1.p1 GENE.GHVL01000436.1~~GHVL01000436.1.p1  ORF type:complete len:342 (-),score=40.37 GHVL01000436.1:399-1424(-)